MLAYESDLLEYGDLFDGSPVVEAKTAELAAGAEAEMAEVAELGGMVPAVESGYLKARLVAAHAARRARIESGQDQVVRVNCFQATEPSPLTADADTAVHNVDPAYELAVLADLAEWCQHRDQAAVLAALGRLRADAARPDVNLMDATLACARAGVTTGEWSFALREVFGEYRAPTGVTGVGAVSADAGQGGRGDGQSPRARGVPGGRPPGLTLTWPRCARRRMPPRPRSGRAGCACCSASRAWTGTPTASSRSPSAPATPGSR